MENSHTKSSQYGGFLKWWYPQMDGLQWKTQFKWMIKRYPHDSGNLHIPSDMCVCACICFCDLTVSKSLPFRFTVCEPILRTLWYPNVCVCVKMAMKKSGVVQSGCKGGMPIVVTTSKSPPKQNSLARCCLIFGFLNWFYDDFCKKIIVPGQTPGLD